MALIDKASLLMVPSTYEAGKLYNVLPSGNRAPDSTDQNSGYDQTRADFDFDRGSNTAATRVNSDGLIEKYRENLLVQSNQFDTTWVPQSGITLTANQQGYDGTNDAWKFEKTESSYRNIRISVSVSGVYTTSVYAKAGTLDLLTIRDGSNQYARFYLSTGTYTLSNSPVSGSMVSVGNGWYRCSVTMTTSNPTIQIYPDWNQTNAGYIYIQNAQLESGLVATDYLDSTSVTGKAGVLVDLPRINYDANGENGSLLLEPSRQNFVRYSEHHSGTYYGNDDVTTTDNEATSPEGVQNAAKIVLDNGTNTSNGGHYLSFSSTASTNYTISVFAKAGEYRYFTFTYGSSAAAGGHFDLQEGTLLGTITNANYSNVNPSIEDYGNGWYRLIVSLTDNNSVSGRFLSMKPSPSASVPNNNNYSSTGDGTSGAYIYGFQLEASASYPSSYIPNHGESGGVTRAADSCSVTGVSDVIGQTEGTFVMNFNYKHNQINTSLFETSKTNSNIYALVLSDFKIRFWITLSGSNEVLITTSTIPSEGNHKLAVAYKQNDACFYLDGALVGNDTSCSIPAVSELYLNQPNADVFEFIHFNERLENAELATLTTL